MQLAVGSVCDRGLSHKRPVIRRLLGGVPLIPGATAIPRCKLCNAEQAFYFQVAFPPKHVWEGLSLAVFSCVACVDEEHLIPEPDTISCVVASASLSPSVGIANAMKAAYL